MQLRALIPTSVLGLSSLAVLGPATGAPDRGRRHRLTRGQTPTGPTWGQTPTATRSGGR